MTVRERFDQEAEELRSVRDELKVRMHLAKLDAEELWEELEGRWQNAEARLKVLGEASSEAAEDVAEAVELVFQELKHGYEKLRRLI